MTDDHSAESHMQKSHEFLPKLEKFLHEEGLCVNEILISLHSMTGAIVGSMYGEEKQYIYIQCIQMVMSEITSPEKIKFNTPSETIQ